jgi:hypothetical protein
MIIAPANNNTDNTKASPRLLSIAVMMANGMVCVLPVKFPANIMVAPNSENALAQASPRPARIDGAAKGSVNLKNDLKGDMPRVCDISSYSVPTD